MTNSDNYQFSIMSHSLIRTITVGIGISPIQSSSKLLLYSPFEESRTITAGRELHPAPSILSQRYENKRKTASFPLFVFRFSFILLPL